MTGPPVAGQPVASPVMLIGQAPGPTEVAQARPFAWTAGKTLFGWFRRIGLEEQAFRQRIYMAAVCRCFPGKNPKGGDRLPNRTEVAACGRWLERELHLLRPQLILPVGKLAIGRFLELSKLAEVIGQPYRVSLTDGEADLIPLPHPSGASTWHRTEPGKTLLQQALDLVQQHPAWRKISGDT